MPIDKQPTTKTADELNKKTASYFNTLLNNEVAAVVKNIDTALDKRATLGIFNYIYQHSNLIESIDRQELIDRLTKYYRDLNYVVTRRSADSYEIIISWDKPTKIIQ